MGAPRTLWEEQDGVQSGGGGMIRAAAFTIGGAERTAVTLTVRVPDGFYNVIDGGGASATLLITSREARGFAAWLDAAADAADAAAPPLFE